MTILADGQVADDVTLLTEEATLFTVGGADVLPISKAILNKITFFNVGPGTQTALLFVRKFGGNSRSVRQFKLKQNESGEYLEPGETLELDHGDSLLASTTSATNVDFVIIGTLV